MRDPHAFTPMLEEGVRGAPPRSLTLGSDLAMNQREIGKFSEKDAMVRKASVTSSVTLLRCPVILCANVGRPFFLWCCQAYPDFVACLDKLGAAIHPLLDAPPVDVAGVATGSLRKRLAAAKTLRPIVKCGVFGKKTCLGNAFFQKKKNLLLTYSGLFFNLKV